MEKRKSGRDLLEDAQRFLISSERNFLMNLRDSYEGFVHHYEERVACVAEKLRDSCRVKIHDNESLLELENQRREVFAKREYFFRRVKNLRERAMLKKVGEKDSERRGLEVARKFMILTQDLEKKLQEREKVRSKPVSRLISLYSLLFLHFIQSLNNLKLFEKNFAEYVEPEFRKNFGKIF